jgi:hypothetical protein
MLHFLGESMTAARDQWLITSKIDDIREGLFGQVALYVFEVLVYLHGRGIPACWEIRSRVYGREPNFLVIPGAFDTTTLSAESRSGGVRKNLLWLRDTRGMALGGDFRTLSDIWHRSFAIPVRVLERADALGLAHRTLGLHFRGTDKVTSLWDTNPIRHDEFLELIADFLETHKDVEKMFVATDDPTFIGAVGCRFPSIPLLTTGPGISHKEAAGREGKADHAVLDCVLLARCRWVLKTSSALPAFAKVLNPDLEIYRVAASKLFDSMPYFPVAYIPILKTTNPRCLEILERLLKDDWTAHPHAFAEFGRPFAARRVPMRVRWTRTFLRLQLRAVRKIRQSAEATLPSRR